VSALHLSDQVTGIALSLGARGRIGRLDVCSQRCLDVCVVNRPPAAASGIFFPTEPEISALAEAGVR